MAMDNTQNRIEEINDADRPRHGLDDSSHNDPEKGAALGGLGGAAVGAAAGSIAGPIGTLVGAVAGGLVGAGASGAAVAAVDSFDNDDTVSGIGSGVTRDSDVMRVDQSEIRMSSDAPVGDVHGHNIVTGGPSDTEAGDTGLATGAVVGGVVGAAVGGPIGAVVGGTLGSLAGGVAGDAAEASDEAVPGRADLPSGSLANDTMQGRETIYSTEMNRDEISNPGVANPGVVGTSDLGAPRSYDPVMPGDAGVSEIHGHNIVTGGPATTEAGDSGLAGGAVVGGVVGAAVGGPVGAVVGGTLGSLAGGVAGDAAEAADEEDVVGRQ